MLRKLKILYNSRLFQIMAMCLVGGVLLIVMGVGEIIDSKKTPVDYNSIQLSDLKSGDVIEGDISMNYGAYESIETKSSGKTTGVKYRYIIPVGDKGFAGIEFSNSIDISNMDNMTKETLEVYKGNAEETSTVVHFKGKVNKMSNEDYGYFRDGMKGLGYTDNEIEQYSTKLYIQIRALNGGNTVVVAGAIMVIAGIVMTIIVLLKSKKNGQL